MKVTDHWLLNLKLLLKSEVGFARSPSPGSRHSFSRSYWALHDRFNVVRRSVIFKVPVSHLTKYLVGHLKFVILYISSHLKLWFLSPTWSPRAYKSMKIFKIHIKTERLPASRQSLLMIKQRKIVNCKWILSQAIMPTFYVE